MRLSWLLQGPSEWARLSARTAIPAGTSAQTNEDDGTLVIDLTPGDSTDADGEVVDAMAAQIAWSLALSDPLELRVNGEEVASGSLSEWRGWNAIPSASEMGDTAYFVSDDSVWQFENGAIARDSPTTPGSDSRPTACGTSPSPRTPRSPRSSRARTERSSRRAPGPTR
ncbi:hypothetical protein GCM10029992_02330 [Glycomyces albus]